MFTSNALLGSYLRVVHERCGAEAVSLYIPAASARRSWRPMLVHTGAEPAVPELVDLAAADEFCRRAEVELTARGLPSSPDRDRLCSFPSAVSEGRLLRVLGPVEALVSPPAPDRDRGRTSRSRRIDVSTATPARRPAMWLGLRFETGEARLLGTEEEIRLPSVTGPISSPAGWWTSMLGLGCAIAAHQLEVLLMLHDPVTELPGRAEFRAALDTMVGEGPFALVLANPDDFAVVNEQFGPEAGDRALYEIAGRLKDSLRQSDPVFRYGGAVFAILLPEAGAPEVAVVMKKLQSRLTADAYLKGAVRLDFSFGINLFEPGSEPYLEDPALEVIRRADRTLNRAKLEGGGRFLQWKPDAGGEETRTRDRLSGIFTANMAKDYRNMLLLWDMVTIIASTEPPEAVIAQAIDRLFRVVKPDRVGYFTWSKNGELKAVSELSRRAGAEGGEPTALDPERRALLAAAREKGAVARASLPSMVPGEAPVRICIAAPLRARGSCLGCLLLEGRNQPPIFDRSDEIFFGAFAHQLAVALDRAALAQAEQRRRQQEEQRLRAELSALRQAVKKTQLVHRSAQMEELLTTVRRVAPTDATILITGESGTGKEVLARTLHEFSPRGQAHLVVVDCSAIATSLIDSELFGHERGAFTGAQQRTVGRLVEAHGGTVVLDEIGEVPLEVQGKLLRFFETKELTAVGGTRARRVDARLIAITNRDLMAEVAAGRFREDLYYRLNVVRLTVPPLRERLDDISQLANHFLVEFSDRYQKSPLAFAPQAQTALLAYRWPGNIRELRNRILQAVIMAEGNEIGLEHLDLGAEPVQGGDVSDSIADPRGAPSRWTTRAGRVGRPMTREARPEEPRRAATPGSAHEAWAALQVALRDQIEGAMGDGSGTPFPLGRWLVEDLILAADTVAGGILTRGAAAMGIPEATFRRRLRKAMAAAKVGLLGRTAAWGAIPPRLAALVRASHPAGTNLLQEARQVLLAETAPLAPETGAALMGVTLPTYRRWLADLVPAPEK